MPRGIPNRPAEAGEPETPATIEVPAAAPVLSQRAQETRRERRRRDDGDLDRMGRMALAIPPEVKERLEREGKTARWVRDAAGRQTSMQQNDWDVTPGVDAVPEARDGDGKLVLMEKYRDWHEEDQRKKSTLLDQREEALRRGQIDGSGKSVASEQNQRLARDNRITRGS